jgi:propionate CoA-transferase
MVGDGVVLAVGGSGNGHGVAEAILAAIEARFHAEGHPRGLTLFQVVGIGDWRTRCGVERLAYPGLVRCAIGSNIGNSPILAQMAAEGAIEGYSLPQGVLAQLCRAMAGRQPGLATHVGLHTFVDPRLGGGRLNDRSRQELVELVRLAGQELLFYRAIPPDVALIRATTADEAGNLSFEEETAFLDALPLAQATHNNGGRVIAQVRRLAARGSLPPKSVVVPGIVVDAVVVDPHQRQTYAIDFNPYYAGQLRAPAAAAAPLALDERKIIARRALREAPDGAVCNLGVGVAQGIASVAAEEGRLGDVTFTVEQGAVGGIAGLGAEAGAATNHEAQLHQAAQFDFYDGGGLDVAFLSFAEMDRTGNVNVTRFGGRLNGPGGFINISQGARRVVFCGTLTAGGLEIAAGDGRLVIRQEGKHGKLVERVQEITFSGAYARERGQQVTVVTERAVLDLTPDGLRLLEVAPGIDVERDVLAHMSFRPLDVDRARLMDETLFR